MLSLIVSSLVLMLLWTFGARRLARLHLSGPLVLAAGGVVAGVVVGDGFAEHLDTHLIERIVELVLAVLLFVDATVVRDGYLAGEWGAVARLLAVALPLTVAAAFAIGVPLLPTPSWVVVFAIACVVMPVDFAPAPHLLKDRFLPLRVRHVLAVEGGYNDGLFSPAFAFAILTVDAAGSGASPASALGKAVPAALYAVLVGVGVGGTAGLALRRAEPARWTGPEAVGIATLLLPFVTYSLAVAIGGNGFVAAFLAGIAYKQARLGRGADRDSDLSPSEFRAVEALGTVGALITWFVLGATAVLVFHVGVSASVFVYSFLVLTVARLVPVYLAMAGSPLGWRDRTLLGLVGPRGTTSIVFGLLAYNSLRDEDADLTLSTTLIVVLGSVVLHGVAVPLAVRRIPGLGDHPEGGPENGPEGGPESGPGAEAAA